MSETDKYVEASRWIERELVEVSGDFATIDHPAAAAYLREHFVTREEYEARDGAVGGWMAQVAALRIERDRLKKLTDLMIAYYDPCDHLSGNGCEHGFKPARSCPNVGCEERNLDQALNPEQPK